jgi:hypothetical protein
MEPVQQPFGQLLPVVMVLLVFVLQASPDIGNRLQAFESEHAHLLHGGSDPQGGGRKGVEER